MKPILKNILKYYLKWLTKLALLVHRPVVIAVAGSINKPFVKEAIKDTLKEQGLSVRANPKNFNTEIGLPLSVLYLKSGYNSYRDWLPVILKAPRAVFNKNFPNYLVLGLGTSDPGDMKYLLSVVKPQVTVITNITQRYIESFRDMNELSKEYKLLVRRVPQKGLVVLNIDNDRVASLARVAKAPCRTFSIKGKEADYRAVEIERRPAATAFTVLGAQEEKVEIGRFGDHHIQAFLIKRIIGDYVRR